MKAFMATMSMSIDLLSATHHCIFHHCIIEQYLTSLKESNVHTYPMTPSCVAIHLHDSS